MMALIAAATGYAAWRLKPLPASSPRPVARFSSAPNEQFSVPADRVVALHDGSLWYWRPETITPQVRSAGAVAITPAGSAPLAQRVFFRMTDSGSASAEQAARKAPVSGVRQS